MALPKPSPPRRAAGRPTSILIVLALAVAASSLATAQETANRIDVQRPDAPELAAYGGFAVGVRTVELVHHDQIDVLRLVALEAGSPAGNPAGSTQSEPGSDAGAAAEEPLPRADRVLPVEIWYPAEPGGTATPYRVFLRDGRTEVNLIGRATRDRQPLVGSSPHPLVLISHGYPGNRYLLSHLAENLASKGYVVASIDHTDSTYRTRAAFASTLLHRSFDQLFVLDEIARLGAQPGHFLNRLVDADNTGLIGYSMGGYGALITAGAGVSQRAVDEAAPRGILATHRAGSVSHGEHFDPRIRAVVAFAPWGFRAGFWDDEALSGVRVPILYVAGSVDEVSGYADGVRRLFELSTRVDRTLLTFENAGHNAAAPMPAPRESFEPSGSEPSTFFHYADPVWDTGRMNNIAQHFVTAYLGRVLKHDETMRPYTELVPHSAEGVWARDDDGTEMLEHTYWKGFRRGSAVGLRWEQLLAEIPAN
jgi:predicted dienelactone hydrolase